MPINLHHKYHVTHEHPQRGTLTTVHTSNDYDDCYEYVVNMHSINHSRLRIVSTTSPMDFVVFDTNNVHAAMCYHLRTTHEEALGWL